MVQTDAQAFMDRRDTGDVLAKDYPSRIILGHLTSRWGILVMIALMTGTHRFSALRRRIGTVSERMLTQSLQQLEADGFVQRRALDVMPPHVEYSLTDLGRVAGGHLAALANWVETSLPQLDQRSSMRKY